MFCASCTGKNITHYSQWETAENFDISDLIQFIHLEGVGFFKTIS